jgi:hypothetical protein
VIEVLVAQGSERRGLDQKLWEMFAYVARYGKQPMSEIKSLTLADLSRLSNEISEIVRQEKKASAPSED